MWSGFLARCGETLTLIAVTTRRPSGDALGNRLWVRDPDVIDNVDRTRYHSIDAATGQLTNSVLGTPTCGNGGAGMRSCHPTWYQYEYTQDHDLAGNVIASWGRDTRGSDAGSAFVVPTETRSFYDAADQLTYFNRHSGQTLPGEANGVFEEYRSDALGLRVLVRSRRPSSCASPCEAFVQRTVWDGAQVLYEIRSSGNTAATANAMELEGGAQAGEDPNLFGIVAYAHAEGLDHPVGVLKHYASSVGGSGVWGYVTPHANFQGAWSYGTLSNGATCISVGQNCPAWPGYAATVDGRPQGADVSSYVVWWGDVLRGPTTSGGPQYLRNRYYDAATGRFTQLDPIGLAGGMNLYGFADGDPVNFADPIGLCPIDVDGIPCALTFGIGGILGGAAIGGTVGWVGGTFVIPGVGTIIGGAGGAVAGGLAGGLSGAVAGLSRDIVSGIQAYFAKQAGPSSIGERAPTAGDIIAREKKGSINRVFPGELRGNTTEEINDLARQGDKAAQTARKLLTDKRFNKE